MSDFSGIFENNSTTCFELIQDYLDNNNVKTILSIGCGMCEIEDIILSRNPSLRIIGVDPYPTSYNNGTIYTGNVELHVTHSIKRFYNKDHPDYCRVDSVFIMWPDPNQKENYDLNALELIQPESFCVSFGPCGSSGSQELINVLTEQTLETKLDIINDLMGQSGDIKVLKRVLIGNQQYSLISCVNEIQGTGTGFNGRTLRLVVYKKGDIDLDPYIVEKRSDFDTRCLIM